MIPFTGHLYGSFSLALRLGVWLIGVDSNENFSTLQSFLECETAELRRDPVATSV